MCVSVCMRVCEQFLFTLCSETTAPALGNYEKKNEIIFKDIQNFPFGEMCIHVLQMCLSNTCVYL